MESSWSSVKLRFLTVVGCHRWGLLERFCGEAAGRAFIDCVGCTPGFRQTTNASPVSISSRSSTPPWYDASSAVQQANPANLTQFHLGSFESLQTSFRHSLLHFSTHRWAAALFRLLKRPLPSLQSLRRRLSIHTISATIAHFKPDVPVKASGACGIWTNCWLPWSIPTPPGVAICLPETSINQNSYNQGYVGRLRGGRHDLRHPSRPSQPQCRVDTVDHCILLDRLEHDYGIRGLVIQWIESYLTGRSQFMRYNGVTSKTVPVTSGVPQGSVLGPILFISYSAEVVAIVQHQGFKVHAFADDLQIYGSTTQNGAADLMARMSICIECVASWMSSNRLRLNPSKTELIWLGTIRRLQHCDGFNMTVCGAVIRPVECVWDLGVLIDSNMTLSNHVNNVAGICFYQLRQLRIIHRSLTTDAAHSLVRALIHTRVDYCNGLLAAGPKYLHEKLQSVLRAAARLVLQLPYRASVSDIMRQQLHWLEMPDRVRFKLCTLVYRCLHGLAPHYLSDLCTPARVHAHLRSSVTLERWLSILRTKTKTIGPRGFYFASSAAWNALPVHLRNPELSLSSFKTKLKTRFFSWYPPTWLTLYHVIFVRRARQRDNL